MKNYIIAYLLAFISSLYLHAQTIVLEWASPKVVLEQQFPDRLFPYFKNEGYSLENEVPVYTYSELNVKYNSIQLSNFIWKEISLSDLHSTPIENIPDKETYFSKVVYSRNQPNGLVHIVPYKKEDGKLYRLSSFEMVKNNAVTPKMGPLTFFGNSVLKDGDYFKISVDTTGVHKVDYTFIQNMGLDPSSIDVNKIKVYGNGGAMLSENIDDFRYEDLQENAIQLVGMEDGTFDENDYFLFYAQGPQSLKRGELVQPIHITNIYEDVAYYFLRFDGLNGIRIPETITPTTTNYLTTFDDVRYVEPEDINVNSVGRVWVGDNFDIENSKTFTFSDLNISNEVPVRLDLNLYVRNAYGNTVSVTVNGDNMINNPITTNSDFAVAGFLAGTSLSGNSINATVTVENNSNPLGQAWFDYIEFFFRQNLVFNGSQLSFRRLDNINNGNAYGFEVSNVSAETMVWDVSDLTRPKKYINQTSGSQFRFTYVSTDDFANEFIAFNASSAYVPNYIGPIQNQDLHGLENIDYIIVSAPEYRSNAQQIADFHENLNGLNVVVATTEEVYNEFSSGSQDITAIRDFTRYIYQKGNKQLRFLLLFGDASYDFKNRINNNTNKVPAYQSTYSQNLIFSYVTDDYYAILDDGEESLYSTQLDIGVGRLPANSAAQANALVQKSLSYENYYNGQSSPFGIWRTHSQIVVDDDNPGDPFHETVEQTVSSYVEDNFKQIYVRKLYSDSFNQETTSGGKRYPQVNEDIDNAVETGTLFINYFGHGGPRGWAQERILTEDQIVSYNNLNSVFSRLPLFLTVTCDFSVWDDPNLNSAGEYLVTNIQGGGIASITTSRAIGVGFGKIFNGKLIRQLLALDGDKYQSFGEALINAKISYGVTSTYDNYKVNLLGDPALSLYKPAERIQLNTINGQAADSFTGVLRALDFVTFKGEVLDAPGGVVDSNFNGKLEFELYDKRREKHTLNNDGNLGVMTYTEQDSKIYAGSSSVVNGQFSVGFYMPKDIDYTVGDGKLVIYANNDTSDALYVNNTIKVGEINPDGINDDEPPTAKLFMNNRNFANGGITNKDPILIACVTDSTGINSAAVGIGHDITMVLDGNVNNTKVLNSYFQGGEHLDCPNPSLQDFQKGIVTYNLRNVPEGEHQLKFKVWDINNNSTTETLDFIVVQEGEVGIVINRLLNWPNPFTDRTYFHFEHNCDEILEVQIQIFTISGKLVKTIRQQVTSEPYRKGYRTDKFGIEWDGLDDYGDKIGKGTYIFKATVKGSNSESCSGTATATEKLVILK